ncbi:DNA topoisomerase (ATP-hydrolyzing) subunit A [Candidatus Chlorohelix sp.]|uniref:DNA topoisomerase (ATP-hydrolyzing) subunit A n=1 Tax=Candidatus Chlorohelix sp. TaxID=3139201 RepID=UPI00304A9A93
MAKQTAFDFNQTGPVKPVEFHEVFGQNYGQYGLYVVQDRALPDARDGLKPVQRRILYTLFEGRYLASGPHRKSAEIVGKVLGDRHPHGDSSVYDAMSRMAQPFSLRYPLIDGQGNWGASDGSPAAAYRYTEARLTPLAEALLSEDIKKETVPLLTTYKEDPKVVEPMYLPGHIPPCVNSIDGIAVGISTTVPPHNLGESLRVSIAMLDAGVLEGNSFSIEQLMSYLPGPDFPEGGRIMVSGGGVREYLETGRGRFIIRANVVQEQLTPTKRALVITGLPPIGRDKVIASIIDSINERKPGTEGLVAEPPLDETNEERTRIVLELKREANPAVVLESLYRHTLLQIAVSAQLYFLFAPKSHLQAPATIPKQVGMVELLSYWLHHQLDVLERRLTFELNQYRVRLSTVEALIVGATHAQQLVRIFQEADGKAQAKLILQNKYNLTEEQAEVIANMSLSQVTRPDAGRYQAERTELITRIEQHEELLSSRPKCISLLKQELRETEKKFGDGRRTVIDGAKLVGTDVVEEVAQANVREPLTLALYTDDTLKATSPDQFGAKGKAHKSDESLASLCAVAPDAFVLAGTNKGRIFSLPVEKLTLTTRNGKSESIARHLKLEAGERVVQLLAVPGSAFGEGAAPLYLVEFSALGKVKKTPVSEYRSVNGAGLGSLKLAEGDEVISIMFSNGQGEYLLTTNTGQTLRFGDDKLNPQGRIGLGQVAMALNKGTRIVNAHHWSGGDEGKAFLVILSKQNVIKKTALTEYPAKGRATGGVATTGLVVGDSIVATWLARGEVTLLVVAESGNLTLKTSTLPTLPRARKGQPLEELTGLVGMARIIPMAF